MAVIEKFLGKCVNLPSDRKYAPKQGLWAMAGPEGVVLGFTEPYLVLAGGLNDLDWLCQDGETVSVGQSVAFAITGKIAYIETPIAGTIRFNPAVKQDPALVVSDPYGKGWLFTINPSEPVDQAMDGLLDDNPYLDALKGSEGFKNPDGVKGGVSGMCKAVYSGIREQKI